MDESNHGIRRVALGAALALLVLNLSLTILVVGVLDYPVAEDRDAYEYHNLTTNLLNGHGFAVEPVSPWRPNASRSPGFLVTTIPIKLLAGDHELVAALVGRVWVVASAVLTVLAARRLGLGAFAPFAAAGLLAAPTVLYYLINPYISEPAFLIASGGLYIGLAAWLIQGLRWALPVIALAAGLALAARTAALIPLAGLTAGCLIGGLWLADPALRRRVRLAAAVTAAGLIVVYVGWSLRNLSVFGVFDYTTVSSYNILHEDVSSMKPFLDAAGLEEVRQASRNHRQYFQTYYEADQFEVAHRQRDEGIRLILKYPQAFVASHVQGALETLFIFRTRAIEEKFGVLPIYLASIYQAVLTGVGVAGLYGLARRSGDTVRAALALLLVYAVLNILVASAVKSPRFRLSFDMVMAVGVAALVGQAAAALAVRRVAGRSGATRVA